MPLDSMPNMVAADRPGKHADGGWNTPSDRQMTTLCVDLTTMSIYDAAILLAIAGGASADPEPIRSLPPLRRIRYLSPRQVEVLTLMREGLSNKQIGAQLGIAPGTVKIQTTSIFKCLGVKNRTQAVMRANQIREAA